MKVTKGNGGKKKVIELVESTFFVLIVFPFVLKPSSVLLIAFDAIANGMNESL